MNEETDRAGGIVCASCLRSGRCQQCEDNEHLDVDSSPDRERLIERLASRRKNYIRVMEALAIVLAAGILVVGLAVTAGLGGGLLDWVAKGFAVVVLAFFWQVIPGMYQRFFARRAERFFAEFAEEGQKREG